MSKLRLLQVLGAKGGGGAESFFVRLSQAFGHDPGVHQHLFVMPNEARDRKYKDANLHVTHASFASPYLDLSTHLKFRRIIKTFEPSVVLTWMNRATVFCPSNKLLAGKKKPFKLVARLGGYYNLAYYKHCDYLIGNTPMIVDYLVKNGWPREKAIYLPNFVSENKAAPFSWSELGVPVGIPLILGVGRFHTNKAFDTLLKAFSKTTEGFLVLVGDGPEEEELKSLSRRLKISHRVKFLGWREDVESLMASCDIFVCPSRHEPFGNVVIEAWASNKPVIAARAHGPSMLIEQGVNGLLYDIDDVNALALHLNNLIKDGQMAKNMAEEGYRAYQQSFSPKVVIDQYKAYFSRIT